jgi:putative oxidoreductase
MGMVFAWTVTLLQVGCSLALLTRRQIVLACLGHLMVLAMGIGLVHWPNWYALGGAAEDGHPGAEFSVLLMACLVGLLWAHRQPRRLKQESLQPVDIAAHQGLDIIRVASALILITHPLHGVIDPAGLRDFGHALEKMGFPFGVFLVWTTMFLQIGSSIALVARRFVVPACLGHIYVLSMGIWIAHAPRWFVVGAGENGMEYSVLLIGCFLSMLLAHWPRTSIVENAHCPPQLPTQVTTRE